MTEMTRLWTCGSVETLNYYFCTKIPRNMIVPLISLYIFVCGKRTKHYNTVVIDTRSKEALIFIAEQRCDDDVLSAYLMCFCKYM